MHYSISTDLGRENAASYYRQGMTFIAMVTRWSRSMSNLMLCDRFEPRSHFKSRLSLIVRLNVVLNRTVVVNSD